MKTYFIFHEAKFSYQFKLVMIYNVILRILIASGAGGGTSKKSIGKYFHLKEFGEALKKIGHDYKLVREVDYARGFPSKNPIEWFSKKKFNELVSDYNPDVVFVDRQSHFGLETIKKGIPLFVYLRGHFWSEQEWAKKTIYTDPLMRMVVNLRQKNAEKVFRECQGIFMTADYLDKVIKKHIPNAKTIHFLEGLDASRWYPAEGMTLKHTCVGMCHDANWWGKTKELLVLQKVLEKMPETTFYWVGDGPYKENVLPVLEKYDNFKWLGALEYPNKIRDFLTEIDVYVLLSGIDMSPLTLLEAQLMKKPVIATNVGGIPELMKEKENGFLIEKGDSEKLIEYLQIILNDNDKARTMGNSGRKFVEENFSWKNITERFIDDVRDLVK